MSVSPITAHVLDTANGCPAEGVRLVLSQQTEGVEFRQLATGTTDADGRCKSLLAGDHTLEKGVYKMHFECGPYFEKRSQQCFFPYAEIVFQLPEQPDAHYHIPLLLSPFGYTTYRGS